MCVEALNINLAAFNLVASELTASFQLVVAELLESSKAAVLFAFIAFHGFVIVQVLFTCSVIDTGNSF